MSANAAQYDQAVCIRRWDWSETSEVVWLFTRRLGMVRALAKGSKRPKAPYSGGVEMLTLGEAGVILRPGSDLALLTEWRLTRAFAGLRRSLAALNAGLYAADLLAHMVRDHDPHPGLFDGAAEFLAAIDVGTDLPGALLRWQWSVLAETGFRPDLNGEDALPPPHPAKMYRFSPGLGRVLADDDAAGPGEGAHGGAGGAGTTWRVRAETLEALRVLGSSGVVAAPSPPTPETIDRANRLLASYLRHILGDEPPTMRSVFGAGLQR